MVDAGVEEGETSGGIGVVAFEECPNEGSEEGAGAVGERVVEGAAEGGTESTAEVHEAVGGLVGVIFETI